MLSLRTPIFTLIAEADKVDKLMERLTDISKQELNKTIIFAGTKHAVDYLHSGLWEGGYVASRYVAFHHELLDRFALPL